MKRDTGPSEEVIQQHIMGALRSLGFFTLSTVHRVKLVRCPHCAQQFRPGGGYGATPGVPDVLVRPGPHAKALWPAYLLAGLEVKGAKTPLSPEQKLLQAHRAIIVVRSVDDAMDAIEDINEAL